MFLGVLPSMLCCLKTWRLLQHSVFNVDAYSTLDLNKQLEAGVQYGSSSGGPAWETFLSLLLAPL